MPSRVATIALFALIATVAPIPPLAAVEVRPGEDLQAALDSGEKKVTLAAGTYLVTEPLRLTRGLELVGAPGAETVISGGIELTGWKALGDGRWQVELPAALKETGSRELFVAGERATRARHPDTGTFRIAAAGPDNRTSFRFDGDDLHDWEEPGRIEFVFYHDWSLSRVRMESIDPNTNTATLADPVGQTTARHFAMDWFEKQPRYHLENHPAFLTAAGEWYLDQADGTVTYFAGEGEDPNAVKIIAPLARGLLQIAGAADVRLENLTFRHTNWQLPPGGLAGVQAAFHQVRPAPGEYKGRREAKPAAVTIENSRDIVIRNCQFEQLGASGLWVRGRSSGIAIENCTVRHCGANGLLVGDETSSDTATSHVVISDSLIEHCGLDDFGAVGVWIGLANHVTVRDCELRFLPYTGISVGWRWNPSPTSCHHIIIERNHIHHIMQQLSDGGGIYTLGRQPGTVLRGNRIHNVPVNAGRAESNGMFLDEGTTGIVIEDNTIWDIARSPLRFHQAGKNIVRNNLLYRRDESIPMVRYNNTPEENIIRLNNEAPVGLPPWEN